MGTAWSEVITEYAMVEINDIRLNDKLVENPALFFREMALYMRNAIPRFNLPQEEQAWLSYTSPKFDSYEYVSDGVGTTVHTGKTGYELFCAEIITTDKFGNPAASAIVGASYDAESGDVTLPDGIANGTPISMDFYADGFFENDLSGEEKRILGLCVQLVWENRFSGEWLNRIGKAKDKTFSTPNENEGTKANTARMLLLSKTLNSEMRRYAQNLKYNSVVPRGCRLRRN